jgi:hypothetical protein
LFGALAPTPELGLGFGLGCISCRGQLGTLDRTRTSSLNELDQRAKFDDSVERIAAFLRGIKRAPDPRTSVVQMAGPRKDVMAEARIDSSLKTVQAAFLNQWAVAVGAQYTSGCTKYRLGYSFNSIVDSNEINYNHNSGIAIDRGVTRQHRVDLVALKRLLHGAGLAVSDGDLVELDGRADRRPAAQMQEAGGTRGEADAKA